MKSPFLIEGGKKEQKNKKNLFSTNTIDRTIDYMK